EVASGSREESFAAWRRFFEALAERHPLVLVFEDVQWADDGLLDFVDHLADWARDVPMLILCTARLELLERRPAWGGGKLNAATVALTPLSDEDTARLIAGLSERALLEAETQSVLLDRAGGNPLYAEQFVRDGAYGQIPRVERAQKHLPAAEWIESLGRPEDHAEMVAHHYVNALELARAAGQDDRELVDRARAALRAAGDRAMTLNALPQAEAYFRHALTLLPDEDAERPQLLF